MTQYITQITPVPACTDRGLRTWNKEALVGALEPNWKLDTRQESEGVKKNRWKTKTITPSWEVTKVARATRGLLDAGPCASASLREDVHFSQSYRLHLAYHFVGTTLLAVTQFLETTERWRVP